MGNLKIKDLSTEEGVYFCLDLRFGTLKVTSILNLF